MNKKFNVNMINIIIKKTIENIDNSRSQILNIFDNARAEYEHIKAELEKIKVDISKLIILVDELESKDKLMRKKLLHVSKSFDKYTEADVKKAYENAYEVKVEFITKQNEEKALRTKRTQLEFSLKKIIDTIDNAEKVLNQVGIAASYLKGEILSAIEGMDKNSEMLLGIKILEAQENERKRISRDIHDGPAQHIANVMMKADICERLIKDDVEEGLQELSDLKGMVKLALNDIRSTIFDLRPSSLNELGLKQTIEEFVNRFKQNIGIKVKVNIKKTKIEVEPIIQVAVYRIIQEIFNNIQKHSQATNAHIALEYGIKHLLLVVKDNGVGFNVDETIKKVKTKGESYGIIGILDRVNQLQGEIKMESTLGGGTVYGVKLPVNQEVIKDENWRD